MPVNVSWYGYDISQALGTAKLSPSIDSYFGISGCYDGTFCILCGIPNVRSRL